MANVASIKRQAKGYAEEAGDDVWDQIQAARDYIEELSETLSKVSGRKLRQARKSASAAASSADDLIQDNPYVTAAAALALGVLIGMMLKRW